MARLRYNGLTATLGADLTSTDTTITFSAALTHSGGTAAPTISGSDYVPLTILATSDPDSAVSEVVYLTAYTTGATTGTITRAQESTTGVAHASGDAVVHGPTVLDFDSVGGGGGVATTYTPTLTAATTNPTLGTGSTATGWYIESGDLIVGEVYFKFGSSGASAGSGQYRVSLPVAAHASVTTAGQGWTFTSQGVVTCSVLPVVGDPSKVHMFIDALSAFDVGAGTPATWGAGNEFGLTFSYRKA